MCARPDHSFVLVPKQTIRLGVHQNQSKVTITVSNPRRLKEIATDYRPINVRRNETSNCMLCAIIYDLRGNDFQIPVPAGNSLTVEFHKEIINTQIFEFYQNRKPRPIVPCKTLLFDNPPVHKSATNP